MQTVRRSVKVLINLGLIECPKKGTGHSASYYVISIKGKQSFDCDLYLAKRICANVFIKCLEDIMLLIYYIDTAHLYRFFFGCLISDGMT